MKLPRHKTRNLFIVIFVILVLNTQPGLFGLFFSDLFLFVPMMGIVLLYILFGYQVRVERSRFVTLCGAILYVIWIWIQVLILTPTELYKASVVSVMIPLVSLGCILLIKKQDVATALKTIIGVVTFIALSQCITYALFFLGFRDQLLIMERHYDLEKSPYQLYFPLTFMVGKIQIAGWNLSRAVGLSREPGVYQIFVIIGYFALDFVSLKRERLIRVLLVFSLLTTFSTAGYALFLGSWIYRYIIVGRQRILSRLILLVFSAILLTLFVLAPVFGLQEKLVSSEKRLESPKASWELLKQKFWLGYGIASEEEWREGKRLGVNFLASLHKYGAVGLTLYISLIIRAMYRHYDRYTLVLWFPILLTLLISQPIATTALTFFFLCLSTRSLPLSPSKRDLAPIST